MLNGKNIIKLNFFLCMYMLLIVDISVYSCGVNSVYLSTIDKQGFYLKIGYEFCPPVSIYGSMIVDHGNLKTKSVSTSKSEKICCGTNINSFSSAKAESKLLQENSPSPPLPPLLPLSQQKVESVTVMSNKKPSKLFMKKDLK